ncbi:MAG: DUF2162 domain-containing protein [bacterium]
MGLDVILWTIGTLFTLGIFSVKVGFGLGFGRMGWKVIGMTLAGYVALFVLIAMFSEHLINLLEPVLRKGPYLHLFIATGMVVWGFFILRNPHECKTEGEMLKPSLLLIIPCPICLMAITFSIWAALSVIKLPAMLVGFGMGMTFAIFSFLLLMVTRKRKSAISLGLSMMGIGLYFIAALFLPAKIEEARGIYNSFVNEGSGLALNNQIGVFVVLLGAILTGFCQKR